MKTWNTTKEKYRLRKYLRPMTSPSHIQSWYLDALKGGRLLFSRSVPFHILCSSEPVFISTCIGSLSLILQMAIYEQNSMHLFTFQCGRRGLFYRLLKSAECCKVIPEERGTVTQMSLESNEYTLHTLKYSCFLDVILQTSETRSRCYKRETFKKCSGRTERVLQLWFVDLAHWSLNDLWNSIEDWHRRRSNADSFWWWQS